MEDITKFSSTNLSVHNRFDAPSLMPQQDYSSLMPLQDSQANHNNTPAVLRIIIVGSVTWDDRSKALLARGLIEAKYEADLHEHSKSVFG